MEQVSSSASADEHSEQKAPDDTQQLCDSSRQARLLEESTRKALVLRKKELRWKLMRASQSRNLDKIREIQTALNYHKRKLTKAKHLAARIREKYVKVVKLAKLTELHYKKAEAQLSQQERFLAQEKMQLTKLSLDCMKTGAELFGDNYKLPENPADRSKSNIGPPPAPSIRQRPPMLKPKPKPKPKVKPTLPTKDCATKVGSKEETSNLSLLEKLSPFLRKARIAEPMGYLILDGVQDIASRKAQSISDSK